MGLQHADNNYITTSYLLQYKTLGEKIADHFMETSDLFEKTDAMPRTEFYKNFEPVFEHKGILYIIGRESKNILSARGLSSIASAADLENSRLRFKIYHFDTIAIIYARGQKEGLHNTSLELGTDDIMQLTAKREIRNDDLYSSRK